MTEKEFRNAIVKSYEYTHLKCAYGPSNTTYPPGAAPTYLNDCVGLVFLASYYLGHYPHSLNIDEVVNLCVGMGFVKSTDENDVWKHPGVSCYQDKNNFGTSHVNHVFYSLGGTGLNNISKYDLGSLARIKSKQPFEGVQANEWKDKRNFFCHLYIPENKPCNNLDLYNGKTGMIITNTNIYTGAGTKYDRICEVKTGTKCVIYPVKVTNKKCNTFRLIRLFSGETGYIYYNSLAFDSGNSYKAIIRGTDGVLNVRAGAGLDKPIVGELPEESTVKVLSVYTDENGIEWANVETNTLCGFTTTLYLKKI